jgi:hypothetical protein
MADDKKATNLKAPEGVEKFEDDSTGDITERWTDPNGQRYERVTIGGHNTKHRPGTVTTTKCEELRYYWGRFQAAGQAGDQQIVKVWYFGHGKQYKRGELVIVPSTHLGVCGIANQERFKMVPGEPLKKLAPYNSYGFTVDFTMGNKGEATAEEYNKRISEGTEQNKQLAARGMVASSQT